MTTGRGTDFVLASASPRRLDLLAQIGIAPDRVVAADIDESPLRDELPRDHARRLALAKARACSRPGSVTLAADTVVAAGRRILPKAESADQARACLKLLSGRRHRVYGGIAVIDQTGAEHQRLAVTIVAFKLLTHAEIDAYIASEEWHGKAGGYAIQGLAARHVRFISGSYSNVVGLALHETAQMLAGVGVA